MTAAEEGGEVVMLTISPEGRKTDVSVKPEDINDILKRFYGSYTGVVKPDLTIIKGAASLEWTFRDVVSVFEEPRWRKHGALIMLNDVYKGLSRDAFVQVFGMMKAGLEFESADSGRGGGVNNPVEIMGDMSFRTPPIPESEVWSHPHTIPTFLL